MSGFKFDKNNAEPDFTLGGDFADGTPAPAPKKTTFVKPATPAATPAPKPAATPAQPAPTAPVQPVQPVATPTPAPATPAAPVAPQPAVAAEPATTPQPLIVPPTPAPVAAPIVEAPVVAAPVAQPAPVAETPIVVPQPQPVAEVSRVAEAVVMKPADSKQKGVKGLLSNFKGNRKGVFYVRLGAGIIAVIVIFSGTKAIFFPTSFPSSDVVTQVVANNLGITHFPTDKATGFVTDFTKLYFTITPETSSTRSDKLKNYITTDLLNKTSVGVASTGKDPKSQTVTTQPLIVNIDSIDDNNAVFTMLVKLSTGTTLNVLVPVYYDEKKNAMSVSSPLSIVPGLNTAEVPTDNHTLNWSQKDDAVAKAFQPDLEKYFEAWAVSDLTSITRYITTDATLMTKEGLKSAVTYGSVTSLIVKAVDTTDTTADPLVRTAYATVVFKDANDPAFTYTQGYLLTIKQNPDKKWNIQDIQGTVVKEAVL